jgi:UDP-N-acetylglucosamine:LPS N-acetylglucosamine transferase
MPPPEPRQHDERKPRVLAVSSGGGHWVQLLRLKPAFADCDVAYATVVDSSRHDVEENGARFHLLPDATRWNKLKLIWLLVKITLLVIRERPDAIITTGAAPGYLALVVGRILGRKTCWIDSIANVDELSMSGRKARRWSTLWLTQWEHLAGPDGPLCFGNVISSRQRTDDDGSDESGPGLSDTRSPGIVDTKPNPRAERIEEPDAPRVLAISSGGGHWVELMRLRPAFEGCSVTFASVSDGLRKSVEDAGHRYHRIPDLTRWNVGRVPWAFIKITRILLKERPTVIITTGAGPGYIACIAGKLMGIRCCWVDSIANADELSMSGVKAGRWIDLLLTQWPKLANHDNGAQYKGNVL